MLSVFVSDKEVTANIIPYKPLRHPSKQGDE